MTWAPSRLAAIVNSRPSSPEPSSNILAMGVMRGNLLWAADRQESRAGEARAAAVHGNVHNFICRKPLPGVCCAMGGGELTVR